ncbi:hypothetical protein ACJJIE_21645 [Microbulbifer sp. TRSA001]
MRLRPHLNALADAEGQTIMLQQYPEPSDNKIDEEAKRAVARLK